MTEALELPPDNGRLYERILFSAEQVKRRTSVLASVVIERYKSENPLFVCLLRGGAPFATRLMFEITEQDPYFHPEMDYMTIRTYDKLREPKPPELVTDVGPNRRVADRRIVLVDDLLDTGATMIFARQHLIDDRDAGAVDMIVMAERDKPRADWPGEKMVGFPCPDGWLVGMGLDDAETHEESGRWASYIAIANPKDRALVSVLAGQAALGES